MIRTKILALCLGVTLVLAGCSSASSGSSGAASKSTTQADTGTAAETTVSSDEPVSKEIYAMDTVMTVSAYGENAQKAVDDAQKEIERLDALLTTGSDTSAVGEINKNGSGTLPTEGSYLLKRALEISEETDGAFDPAIYPMMELWGFPTENYRVPTDAEIQDCMKLIDPSNIVFDEDTGKVSFKVDGMALDFGGIAKGYTSAQIANIFKKDGVEHGLINLGGNVETLGKKPDGSNWRVAIQDPLDSESMLGVLETHDTAVITSGGYERYFEQDGKRYHHIIDPSTGKPAESGLISATIVSSDGTLADGLSTSLFIMGKDKAADFWRQHKDEFDYILCDENEKLYVTEGIADAFTSDHEVEVVK